MKLCGNAYLGLVCLGYAIVIVALTLLPGASWAAVLCGATVSLAVASVALRASKFHTSASAVTLLIAWTLVTVGIIVNVHYYTEVLGGTVSNPILNNYDSDRDWQWSGNLLYGGALTTNMQIGGMSYLTAALTWLFGRDITVVLMFQSLCYLLAIIATGGIAWALTMRRDIATVAMIMCACMAYLFGQATMLIKDVPLVAAVGAAALALLQLRKGNNVGTYIMLAVAMAFLSLLRNNFMLMLAMGAALFVIKPGARQIDYRYIAIIAVCVVVWFAHDLILPRQITMQNALTTMADPVYTSQSTQAWSNISGNYVGMPVWRKLMILPLSVIVQFLSPFPWNWARDMVFGPAHTIAHFSYPWYFAGALIIYWIATNLRRGGDFSRIVIWGVVLTIITAFITSGRASRYCLLYLPLLLPAAATVAVDCYRKKSLHIWLGVFCIALISTLFVCHYLQSSAI